MTAAFRVFFVGGRISYHALFNWIRPGLYVTTMLGSPLFQILFFTYLGRYATDRGDDFFIVGNAVQVSAMAGIYGMVMGSRAVVRNCSRRCSTAGEPAGAVRGTRAAHRQRARRIGVRFAVQLALPRLQSRAREPTPRSPQ